MKNLTLFSVRHFSFTNAVIFLVVGEELVLYRNDIFSLGYGYIYEEETRIKCVVDISEFAPHKTFFTPAIEVSIAPVNTFNPSNKPEYPEDYYYVKDSFKIFAAVKHETFFDLKDMRTKYYIDIHKHFQEMVREVRYSKRIPFPNKQIFIINF